MRAVMYLDLAVEQTLNTILYELDPDALADDKDQQWTTKWQRASSVLRDRCEGATLKHQRQMKTLHRLRNLAAHTGTPPLPRVIGELARQAEEMISDAHLNAFSIDLDRYRSWQHVPNARLVALLDEAAEGLKTDPTLALAALKLSYEWVRAAVAADVRAGGRFTRFVSPHTVNLPNVRGLAVLRNPTRGLPRDFSDAMKSFAENVAADLDALRTDTACAAIGIPLADMERFERSLYGFNVNVAVNGRWHIVTTGRFNSDESTVGAAALDFIANFVVTATARHADAIERMKVPSLLSEQGQHSQPAEVDE